MRYNVKKKHLRKLARLWLRDYEAATPAEREEMVEAAEEVLKDPGASGRGAEGDNSTGEQPSDAHDHSLVIEPLRRAARRTIAAAASYYGRQATHGNRLGSFPPIGLLIFRSNRLAPSWKYRPRSVAARYDRYV